MKKILTGTLGGLLVVAWLFWLAAGERRSDANRPLEPTPGAGAEEASLRVSELGEQKPTGERAPLATADGASPATPDPPAPRAESETEFVVRARLVDERGAPVNGGRLAAWLSDGQASAASAEDGEVELAFDRERLRSGQSMVFGAWAAGRARRDVHVDWSLLAPVSTYYLGEIVLLQGGMLAGRVIDERGVPVRGADLIARPPRMEASDGERAAARVWLPWSDFGGVSISGRSGEDGSFLLEGVPAGIVEVLAADGKSLVARSPELEVAAGGVTPVPDLVLRRPLDGDRIAGIVLGADGAPFAGAKVSLEDEDVGYGYVSNATTAADGRFELLAASDRAYMVFARDPATRQQTKKEGARAGDLAVELRFGMKRTLELAVRDRGGPVASFRVVVLDAEQRGLASYSSEAPGLVHVLVPEATFHLYLAGPAYVPLQLGPLEPESVPARLELELERAGGIRGKVLAGGAPVAGATIHAHSPIEEASSGTLAEGFVTYVGYRARLEASTDEQGQFFLTLLASGRYRLHAEASAHARGVAGWLEFTAGTVVEGLEITLPSAGAIEGHLLVASAVDPSGSWIGASDGEGHAHLAQTDGTGVFRFAPLAPGRWQVRRLRPGQERNLAERYDYRYWPTHDSDEPTWDVELRAGQTARFDIDVREEVPCLLEARLALGGQPASGWSVYFAGSSIPLDGDGRFTARARKPGRHWLGFHGAGAHLATELELQPGSNTWELDLPVGEVLFENLPQVPAVAEHYELEVDGPEFALSWSEGKHRWYTLFQENQSASARVERAPAGHVVLRFRGEGESPDDWNGWPVLAELDLAVGAFETVRLP